MGNQYEHNAFQKCFSNLLGVGFRRFEIDVYWDPLQFVWSLCPVEQPELNDQDEFAPIASGPTLSMSSDSTFARVPESTAVPLGDALRLLRRQDGSQTNTGSVETPSTASSAAVLNSSSSATLPPIPTVTSYPTTNGPPLVQIGSYNCTAFMTLGFLTGVLEDFLDVTATTTGAAIQILTLNLHATSSLRDPDGPAPVLSQIQLPQSGSLLSDILKTNLTNKLYTPTLLRSQQANLNDSWYDVDWDNRPELGYFRDSVGASGNLATLNGWPSEAFMEFKELYRLVAGFGTIDSQMQYYNHGPDMEYIFPPGLITTRVEAEFGSNGEVSSGCLFNAGEDTVTSQTNSSWAITVLPSLDISGNPDLMVPIPSVTNLTSCGLSSTLNHTLANATADQNPLPYAAFVHSTLWSWAPGEPLNVTSTSINATGNRCTIILSSGRWRVTDCTERFQVACQDPVQPYHWEVSESTSDYQQASSTCPSPLLFSVPHTALENAHLLAAMRSRPTGAAEPVYIDLNSLGVPDCWVVGLNGTCPYLPKQDTNRTRIVVVPTVAAVIIFVLAALTFFVKCGANRRENKRGRRRRMVGGWEYEGVPS